MSCGHFPPLTGSRLTQNFKILKDVTRKEILKHETLKEILKHETLKEILKQVQDDSKLSVQGDGRPSVQNDKILFRFAPHGGK